MMDNEAPLDADELMNFGDRIDQLPAEDAEWVSSLFQECLRARMHEAELLTGLTDAGETEKALPGCTRMPTMVCWGFLLSYSILTQSAERTSLEIRTSSMSPTNR